MFVSQGTTWRQDTHRTSRPWHRVGLQAIGLIWYIVAMRARWIVIIAAGLLMVVPSSKVMAEHYHIFILAGQSNMDGRGKTSELVGDLAPYAGKQGDVLICYSNSTMRGPYTSGGWKPLEAGYSVPPGTKQRYGDKYAMPAETFGPEVGFGKAVAEGMKGKHVAIIKFSEGGTSLQKDWNPAKRGMLYDQMIAFVKVSLKQLKDRGDTYELAGFVWHQGESDASLAAGEYQKRLEGLVKRVREDFKAPALPVVIGEVFDDGHRDRVRAGQLAACETGKNMYFASAKGLTTSDKGTHFDTASQIEMGKRLAGAYLEKRGVDQR
jgi:iduronate 2-sulfatase